MTDTQVPQTEDQTPADVVSELWAYCGRRFDRRTKKLEHVWQALTLNTEELLDGSYIYFSGRKNIAKTQVVGGVYKVNVSYDPSTDPPRRSVLLGNLEPEWLGRTVADDVINKFTTETRLAECEFEQLSLAKRQSQCTNEAFGDQTLNYFRDLYSNTSMKSRKSAIVALVVSHITKG